MQSAASQIRIVFTDVDGTLVNNEHHPIPASARTIARVAAMMPFCLVSARSPEGLYPIQRQLGFTGPLACFSGAYVLDEEGNELYSSVISFEDAREIKRYLDRELPNLVSATYGFHDWIVDDRSDPRVVREEYYVQAKSRESHDLEGTFGERGVHKFLLMGDPASIVSAQRVLAERYPHLNVVRCEGGCHGRAALDQRGVRRGAQARGALGALRRALCLALALTLYLGGAGVDARRCGCGADG